MTKTHFDSKCKVAHSEDTEKTIIGNFAGLHNFTWHFYVHAMYMHFFHLSYGSSYQSFPIEEKFLTDENIVEACEATEEDLLVVHTKGYLNRLKVMLSSIAMKVIVVPHLLAKFQLFAVHK